MTELFTDIRDALLRVVQSTSTMAKDRVRLGRRVPLENPFAITAPNDELPLCTVSMDRAVFETADDSRGRASYTVRVSYQASCYIAQNIREARSKGLTPDEWVDQQLDLFAAQVVRSVFAYSRWRPHTNAPAPIRLPQNAEIAPEGITKMEAPSDNSVLVGLIVVGISAKYDQDIPFDELETLKQIESNLSTESLQPTLDIQEGGS